MKKLRAGDPVIIIAWKHKWKISTIEKVHWDHVIVKDVNVAKSDEMTRFCQENITNTYIKCYVLFRKRKKASKIKIEITSNWKKIRKAKKVRYKNKLIVNHLNNFKRLY